MKKLICLFLCFAAVFCFSGCKGKPTNSVSTVTSSSAQSIVQSSDSSSSEITSSETKPVSNLSLEDKISRLFLVKPETLNLDSSGHIVSEAITKMNPRIISALQKYKVSGVILFDKNIVNENGLKNFTCELQKTASLPLFISIDEEGGNVSRLANHKNLSVDNVGFPINFKTPENVKRAYESITKYLVNYGFNLNFAPVADVFTNPKNTVIGSRAFGKDPETVSSLLVAAIEGHKKLPHCVKHFPGHGDTTEDTHNGSVKIDKTWEELLKCELIPFKTAIEQNCDMIMTSHIILPHVTKEKLPTSLSYELVTEKLRKELGFNGVVITDSFVMDAITENYSSGDAAVLAIKAGVDIILCPANLVEAHTAVLNAVKKGEISEERIDESVKRIDALFEKYNIK